MQDARVRGALLAIFAACLIGSGWVLLHGRQVAPAPIVFSPSSAAAGSVASVNPLVPPTELPAASARPARLFVDVAGAVRRPSLYVLPPRSRVMQAILAAGGPTAAADVDAVNLAEPLTDGEKVFVPKRGAAPETSSSETLPSSLAAPHPALSTAAAKAPSASGASAKSGKGGSRGSKLSADSGEQIGLNSATLEQLERLPGVGPSMAARILAYRQQSGGFAKVEDLTLVTGIGPKKYAKLAPFVSLN